MIKQVLDYETCSTLEHARPAHEALFLVEVLEAHTLVQGSTPEVRALAEDKVLASALVDFRAALQVRPAPELVKRLVRCLAPLCRVLPLRVKDVAPAVVSWGLQAAIDSQRCSKDLLLLGLSSPSLPFLEDIPSLEASVAEMNALYGSPFPKHSEDCTRVLLLTLAFLNGEPGASEFMLRGAVMDKLKTWSSFPIVSLLCQLFAEHWPSIADDVDEAGAVVDVVQQSLLSQVLTLTPTRVSSLDCAGITAHCSLLQQAIANYPTLTDTLIRRQRATFLVDELVRLLGLPTRPESEDFDRYSGTMKSNVCFLVTHICFEDNQRRRYLCRHLSPLQLFTHDTKTYMHLFEGQTICTSLAFSFAFHETALEQSCEQTSPVFAAGTLDLIGTLTTSSLLIGALTVGDVGDQSSVSSLIQRYRSIASRHLTQAASQIEPMLSLVRVLQTYVDFSVALGAFNKDAGRLIQRTMRGYLEYLRRLEDDASNHKKSDTCPVSKPRKSLKKPTKRLSAEPHRLSVRQCLVPSTTTGSASSYQNADHTTDGNLPPSSFLKRRSTRMSNPR
ncbi:MAG: hypothetical protein KVP17_000127 [Porospora cf. gigantea B]|nr:MAG: hypothetical protein KVP17_000127 [Porospora cf. gigantea B]